MKLIVTSDDYGFTYGVTDGILYAAREGILTQTGLFSNMESATYAAERMLKDYPHIALGEDINLVAGYPCADPKLIPSLVRENGMLKSSGMHRQLDKTQPEHIPYEEAYIETKAQVERFIELAGRKPEYLQGHSYGTKQTTKARIDVAGEYGIPVLSDYLTKFNLPSGTQTAPWNNPSSPDWQQTADPIGMFERGELTYLTEALRNDGIAHIHVHAGFMDDPLTRMSTFTLIRTKDLQLITDRRVVDWVKENNVELINIRDLLKY